MAMNPASLSKYLHNIIRLVYDNRFGKPYNELMYYLYSREFTWTIPMDINRAKDGLALREKYGYPESPDNGYSEPCSVLEMLIALACRIENQLKTNYEEGDRTGQWFWIMITNLGLNEMDDEHFNSEVAEFMVNRFLNRDYKFNGEGGALFVVDNPGRDMREVEIWFQMNWYISEQDGYL